MTAFAWWSLAVTYIAAFAPWLFIGIWHVLSRGTWRRDAMGWHIMAITAIDGLIFTMALGAVWWPPIARHAVYQWSYLAVVAGIPVVTIWRGVILVRLYRERPTVVRPRRPWRHPVKVWQGVLAVAQVLAAEFMSGPAHGKLAIVIGTAQVALASYTYGRARARDPVPPASIVADPSPAVT